MAPLAWGERARWDLPLRGGGAGRRGCVTSKARRGEADAQRSTDRRLPTAMAWLASAPRARGQLLAVPAAHAEELLPLVYESSGGAPSTARARSQAAPSLFFVAAAALCVAGAAGWLGLGLWHLHRRPSEEWLAAAAAATKLQSNRSASVAGAAIGLSDNGTFWAPQPSWETSKERSERLKEQLRLNNSLHTPSETEDAINSEVRRVFVDWRPDKPRLKEGVIPNHGITGKTGTRNAHDARDILRSRGDAVPGSKRSVPKRISGQYLSWMQHAHDVATGEMLDPNDPPLSRVRAIPELQGIQASRSSALPQPAHQVLPHQHKHVGIHVRDTWISRGSDAHKAVGEHINSLVSRFGSGKASKLPTESHSILMKRGHGFADVVAPVKTKITP